MSRSDLSLEELDVLEEALATLEECEIHFKLRDRANAKLHLAPPKYSPITKLVSRAVSSLTKLLESSPADTANPDNGDDKLSEPADQKSESGASS